MVSFHWHDFFLLIGCFILESFTDFDSEISTCTQLHNFLLKSVNDSCVF